jgi:tripartite-type tricarboxylate transporter receptor subunit TctC
MRKRFLQTAGGVLAVLVAAWAAHAVAQPNYPAKAVRFVVPYAAGGSVEPLVRLFTVKLTETFGQPMLVDPRPGGNTVIGTEIVAKAAPDGYTFLVMTVPNHAINSILIPNLPYDSVNGFAPVATVSTSDYMLVLHPSVPADHLKAFIAFARARPGQLNYGSVGSLGISQLGTEMFCQMTGIKMQRVPYKGSAPALIDLASGELQVGFNTPISAMPHIQSRRLKPIAISGERRLAALAQVPTFKEAGLPGFEMRVTYAVLAPAGTPRGHIDKLSAELGRIVALPETQARLAQRGMLPLYSTPDQLAAMLKADIAKYAKVIKAANLRFEK